MRKESLHILLLLLVSGFLFLYGIHKGEIYRTEGLRAIIGSEMLRSGNWIVPHLYGEPILTKPPMHYWLIALTGMPFGEVTTNSARLPAAIASMTMCLIVYFTMRRYVTSNESLILAILAPCAFLWIDKASSAEIDAVLVFWVVAAWSAFLKIDQDFSSRFSLFPTLPWWFLCLLCVAAGVLTKWTGFLFFYAMAIPYLILRKRWLELFAWPHLLAACVGAIICFVWLGLVIHQVGWDSAWTSWLKEAAPRILPEQNRSRHLLMDSLLHPWIILAITLPLSLLACLSFVRGWIAWPSRLKPLVLSLQCWAGFGTLLMALFPDHNTRQSFPLCPAWTLLGGLVGLACYRGWLVLPALSPVRMRWACCLFLVLWCILKVIHVEAIIPHRKTGKNLSETAARIREFVPKGETLHIRGFKDECLMFRSGLSVVRLTAPAKQTPSDLILVSHTETTQISFWAVTVKEYERLETDGEFKIVHRQELYDSQGDPFWMVGLRSNELLTR